MEVYTTIQNTFKYLAWHKNQTHNLGYGLATVRLWSIPVYKTKYLKKKKKWSLPIAFTHLVF